MKRQILNAAMELFSKGGYQGVSMRGIAKRIEYSPGAIYRYFESKDEIMLQLCMQGFEELYDEQRILVSAHTAPHKQLLRMGQAYLAYAHEKPEMYELMFGTAEFFNIKGTWDYSQEELEGTTYSVSWQAFDMLKKLVAACMDEGTIARGDLKVTSMGVWASWHGLAHLLIKKQLHFVEKNITDEFVTRILMTMFTGNLP